MGLNKKYISKDKILKILNEEGSISLIRESKINSILNAEILLMDNWCSNFFDNLKPEERKIREKLVEKYRFDSSNSFINDDDFKKLTSISEAFISICSNNPLWIDIIVIGEGLNIKFDKESSGRFKELKKVCIEAVIKHFDAN